MSKDKINVFVYGSLKKGRKLSAHMHDAEFVKDDKVKGYRLYQVKGAFFPAVVESHDGGTVKGELYEADRDILETLDVVEGCTEYDNGLFVRRQILTEGGDSAYIYLANEEWFKPREHELIEKGEWL